MCNIAPFCMDCKFEKTRSCLVHRFNYEIHELRKHIPIIGRVAKTYYCPDFSIKNQEEEKFNET